MKALVAGGGIGGLTAALAFHHFGWQVELLEQSMAFGEVGAGIQVSPNAMQVYAALGLTQQLCAVGFEPEATELRMGLSGLHLLRMPLGAAALARWGAPYLHLHRVDLVAVLARSLQDRLPSAVHFGSVVTGYEQDAHGVRVRLADGQRLSGDVLIGADGIHSAIRAQLCGPDQPLFTGNVAWRAVVPVERLGTEAPRPVTTAWMGPGAHAVTYRLRQGRLANFVGVVERDGWRSESWNEPGDRADALRDFAGWHPTVTRLIETADTLYQWALFDRPPLRSWTDGRVALMGDAAHPMLPFMAQGAAMAVEDAWAVAACVAGREDVAAGLMQYQQLRAPRAAAAQAGSRANAATFHRRTNLGRLLTYGPMWLAGRIAPWIGQRRQDWLYGYDVTAAGGTAPSADATGSVGAGP